MSFAAYASDPIHRLIVTASEAPKVSLLVGAGASMEAGLPSWNALVNRLLERGAEKADLLPADDPRARELWLEDAGRDGPLGAAAMMPSPATTATPRSLTRCTARLDRRASSRARSPGRSQPFSGSSMTACA